MRTLSEKEELKAAEIHRTALVVDSLGVGPVTYSAQVIECLEELERKGASAARAFEEVISEMRASIDEYWDIWRRSGVTAYNQTIGVFGEPSFGYQAALNSLAYFQSRFDKRQDIKKVLCGNDLTELKKCDGHGVILGFQNAIALGDRTDNVDFFHAFGVRVIQLTYNTRNLLGDGCTERAPAKLSRFGLDVVAQMNSRGVLIDLSHCSEPTALDAIENSRMPVAVTHGTAKAVYDHARGKSDNVMKALRDAGGYFGVCAVPYFLTNEKGVTLDHFMRHFEHVLGIMGPKQIGVGSDWGMAMPAPLVRLGKAEILKRGFRAEDGNDWGAEIGGFHNFGDWSNFTRAFVARGYSNEEIVGFIGSNFARTFSAACDI